MIPHPEKKLVESLKNGNLASFEEILFLYEKAIFNYVYRLVGQKQDAQDLTQDVFIKIFKFRSQIDPEKNLTAWIFKIATNSCYDWLRKKKNEPILMEPEQESAFAETNAGESPYINIELGQDLEKAMGALEPSYKTVLLLRFYNDLPYQEIAKTLAIPVNTVKIQLHRAKKALKEKFKKDGLAGQNQDIART